MRKTMTTRDKNRSTDNAVMAVCLFILTFAAVFTVSGCAGKQFPPLPENAPAIGYGEVVYSDGKMEDGYITIEYNERVYAPYGTVAKSVRAKDVDECIGYLYREEYEDDRSIMLYTLVRDPDCNYIMEKTGGFVIMDQPSFWRALDTRGKDIYTPDYICSLEYALWEN